MDECIQWLQQAPESSRRDELEGLARYLLAKKYSSSLDFRRAEEELTHVPASATRLRPLVNERLRLIRSRATTFRDLGQLRERFGTSCSRCSGDDLFVIATCDHQHQPIPRTVKLRPDSLVPPVSSVYACGAYRPGWDREGQHPLSRLVRREKQRIDEPSLLLLAAVLTDFVRLHTPLVELVDALVPVPTARSRQETRGGGIPTRLAQVLRDQLALPLREALVQVGEHRDHTAGTARERSESLAQAWQVRHSSALEGMTVLLVDDIVTTGTTLKAGAQLLRGAGVADVHAVALLHTEKSR